MQVEYVSKGKGTRKSAVIETKHKNEKSWICKNQNKLFKRIAEYFLMFLNVRSQTPRMIIV